MTVHLIDSRAPMRRGSSCPRHLSWPAALRHTRAFAVVKSVTVHLILLELRLAPALGGIEAPSGLALQLAAVADQARRS